jgi:hypothetical protein
MSENHAPYSNSGTLPETPEAFKNRPCARAFSDSEYQAPAPEEIARLIELVGWSQSDVAKITGVNYNSKKGSSTVRRWKAAKTDTQHRAIPYAAWRLLLINAGVVNK